MPSPSLSQLPQGGHTFSVPKTRAPGTVHLAWWHRPAEDDYAKLVKCAVAGYWVVWTWMEGRKPETWWYWYSRSIAGMVPLSYTLAFGKRNMILNVRIIGDVKSSTTKTLRLHYLEICNIQVVPPMPSFAFTWLRSSSSASKRPKSSHLAIRATITWQHEHININLEQVCFNRFQHDWVETWLCLLLVFNWDLWSPTEL